MKLRDILRNDPSGYLSRTYSSLAASVQDTFPDITVIRLLTSPALLPMEDHRVPMRAKPLDVRSLALICHQYLGFGDYPVIIQKFQSVLWPAEAVRLLVMESIHRVDSSISVRVLCRMNLELF